MSLSGFVEDVTVNLKMRQSVGLAFHQPVGKHHIGLENVGGVVPNEKDVVDRESRWGHVDQLSVEILPDAVVLRVDLTDASGHISTAPEWCGIIECRNSRSPILVWVRISAKQPRRSADPTSNVSLAALDGNMWPIARTVNVTIGATIISVT